MKKSLIATAGVAAFAVAAVPAAVFAAPADPTPTSFTDSLSVTVQGGCTIETAGTETAGSYENRTFSNTIATGTVGYLNDNGSGTLSGDQLTVTCNGADSTKAWTVTVTPPTSGTLKGTQDSSKTIAPGAGDQTSGANSGWSIKSNASGGTFGSNPFQNYTQAPTAAAEFLKGSLAEGGSGSFNPSYRVYVGPTQAPETYIGDVVYTVTVGANS